MRTVLDATVVGVGFVVAHTFVLYFDSTVSNVADLDVTGSDVVVLDDTGSAVVVLDDSGSDVAVLDLSLIHI